MPDISELNGTAIANVAEFDALTVTEAPAFTGLLDTYPASAAYSVRKLKTGVTVAARIRRSGDNIEADVEFDSNDEISLTSPISNASSGTFTDLADFVDHTGTARDAFIDEWKDQSGNLNHVSQVTYSAQPKLYDASTGLIEAGSVGYEKPAIKFAGSETLFFTNELTFDADDVTFTAVCTIDNLADMLGVKMGPASNRFYIPVANSTNIGIAWASSFNATFDSSDTNQHLYSVFGTASGDTAYQDGIAETLTNRTNTWTSGMTIGGFNSGQPSWDGTFQEVILWLSDESDSRTDIEDNINNYFNTF